MCTYLHFHKLSAHAYININKDHSCLVLRVGNNKSTTPLSEVDSMGSLLGHCIAHLAVCVGVWGGGVGGGGVRSQVQNQCINIKRYACFYVHTIQ